MAVYIAIPKLGMTMKEATLVEWKVKEGDYVKKSDALLEIETEKTKWEVEAAASGFVHILVEEDVKAPVGRVVGLIAETKEELEAIQKEPPKDLFTTIEASTLGAQAVAPAAAVPTATKGDGGKHIRISPVARKMAEENMIDISIVTGTGPDGRIVREDIEKAIEAKKRGVTEADAPLGDIHEGKRIKTTIPLKGMRKAIAEHMQRSLSVAAQLTDMGEIDMTEVVNLRNSLIKQEDTTDTRITYTDIFVLVVARALKDHPIINSSLINNEITIWEDINIGIAVAIEDGLEGGLIVPVLRNADRKSLVEINTELKSLAEKARAGKCMPDDVSGGTFTITNLGALVGGWSVATPIINQPESAIFSTGAITDRAVVREGQIVVRPVMTYSFTYDHRVIDGAPAGRFMARVKTLLENTTNFITG